MKTVSKFILTAILGWEIKGELPSIKKSVAIFAPHTSYWDGLYGILYLKQLGVNYRFLSKKEFFKFPLKYFFRVLGSIPVYKNIEYIDKIAGLINSSNELHIVMSPEGQLAKTTRWKRGYFYIAKRANVPIIVGYIDYKKKEIGIKGVIENLASFDMVKKEINELYADITAKHPENFSIELIK